LHPSWVAKNLQVLDLEKNKLEFLPPEIGRSVISEHCSDFVIVIEKANR